MNRVNTGVDVLHPYGQLGGRKGYRGGYWSSDAHKFDSPQTWRITEYVHMYTLLLKQQMLQAFLTHRSLHCYPLTTPTDTSQIPLRQPTVCTGKQRAWHTVSTIKLPKEFSQLLFTTANPYSPYMPTPMAYI